MTTFSKNRFIGPINRFKLRSSSWNLHNNADTTIFLYEQKLCLYCENKNQYLSICLYD